MVNILSKGDLICLDFVFHAELRVFSDCHIVGFFYNTLYFFDYFLFFPSYLKKLITIYEFNGNQA